MLPRLSLLTRSQDMHIGQGQPHGGWRESRIDQGYVNSKADSDAGTAEYGACRPSVESPPLLVSPMTSTSVVYFFLPLS